MVMTGTTFDRMRVTPKMDALLYQHATQILAQVLYGYEDGLSSSATGLKVTTQKGAAIIYGRLCVNDAPVDTAIPANTKGYLCIVIDLTQVNTSTGTPGQDDYVAVNNQVSLKAITAANLDALTQEDLLNGGNIYQMPLYQYSATGSAVTLTKIDYSEYLPTFMTGFSDYNSGQRVFLRRVGRMCSIYGAIKNANEIKANTNTVMATFPKELTPAFNYTRICQGSSSCDYMFTVGMNGNLTLARYKGTVIQAVPAGSWLTVSGTWIAERAF